MDRLRALQRAIEARASADRDAMFVDRLCVTRVGEIVHLDFYGDPRGESFLDLIHALSDQAVANSVVSLDLRGPDTGANGTRRWDLSSLANSSVAFPVLNHLSIERTKPADHNRTIVARIYDEDGVLGKLLAKAPKLQLLESPSAPNHDFFRVRRHPLECLLVDAGYDHQGFIANLARSKCFPKLRFLEYGEYNETYMHDFSVHVTSFADYRALFQSRAFASLKVFQWKNPVCSPTQIAELRTLKKECQITVIRWFSECVP